MNTDGDAYRLPTPRTPEQRVKQMEIIVSLGKFTIGVDTAVIGGVVIGGSQYLEGSRWLWMIGFTLLCALVSQAAAFLLVWTASMHTDPLYEPEAGDRRHLAWALVTSFVGTSFALCALAIFAWVNLLIR